MNRLQFGEGACEKTRRYMDAYLSNELLVETTHDVLRHLESCPACTAELEARTRLRSRLKAAVEAQTAPPHLHALVREKLRNNQPARWRFYAVAAVAMLIVTAVWLRPGPTPLPDIADRAAQATYIQKVSATVAQVFKPGLGDHQLVRIGKITTVAGTILAIVASPLPPTLTNATSALIATTVPSMVWPF